jgi:hypothetical protein
VRRKKYSPITCEPWPGWRVPGQYLATLGPEEAKAYPEKAQKY